MNRDLFLAILSLDAYNRGYGPGIKMPAGTTIGLASIGADSSVLRDGNDLRLDEPVGFYAIAYELPAGYVEDLSGTVVSYRGTDNISFFGSGDIVNGWFIGGGAQGDWAGAQAPLSIEFYKAVVGVDDNGQFEGDPFNNNITLTGHSLGGGLAGYVASIYGRSAGIYDNMPFELASDITRERALADESGSRGDVKDFVYGQYDVADIDRSDVRAMSASFEVLAALRLLGGQQTPVDTLDKSTNKSGFQRAHVIGDAFAQDDGLSWFRRIKYDWQSPRRGLSRFQSIAGESIRSGWRYGGQSDLIGMLPLLERSHYTIGLK